MIITREQWGARPPRNRTRIPGPVAGVARHYEGVNIGRIEARCDDRVRRIQNDHMDRNWDDIAYSFLVTPGGIVYAARGPGVRTAANGTNDANARFYAGCILMGPDDRLTEEAKAGWLEGREWLRREGGAGPATPPHSQFKATACPGNAIRGWNVDDSPDIHIVPVPIIDVSTNHPSEHYSVEVEVTTLPMIRQGDSGQHVRIMQSLVVANGRNIAIDGDFGPRTAGALQEWQGACGLDADAVCGPVTWRRLLCI